MNVKKCHNFIKISFFFFVKLDANQNDKDDGNNTSSESDAEEGRSRISFEKKNHFGTTHSTNLSNQGLGNWEQHTRGIGAKLLLQMGYEPGKGLGKTLQGISQPVQAHVRKGRGAIGAYGSERGQTIGDGKSKLKPKIDEDEKELQDFQQKINQWRKDPNEARSKKKRYYKSAQEIIEKGSKSTYLLTDRVRYVHYILSSKKMNEILPEFNNSFIFSSKMNNVTVIDMTGPEKRILSGYHAIGGTKITDEDLNRGQTKDRTNFDMPELRHNLNLILEVCEQEIITIDKSQKTASDRKTVLRQERENLDRITKLEMDHINTLEGALELVSMLTSPKQQLTLDKATQVFYKIRTDYPAEYEEFNLVDLVPGVIGPLLQKELQNWDPIQDPSFAIQRIQNLKESIFENGDSKSDNLFDPYSSLIWFGIVPSIRKSINNWDPKNHSVLLNLLDTWASLLPSHILDNILEKMVLARISTGIDLWDPTTANLPVDLWVIPWHNLLGEKMKHSIYPAIMNKLSEALVKWSPSDRTGRLILHPWCGIFSNDDFKAFLLKNIVPKLQLSLSELIINPLHQDLSYFNQVWEWNEILSIVCGDGIMAQMLSKYFFPKWMQTLVIWLNQNPNLEQVSLWYSGWKSRFSEAILQHSLVKEHFRRALELMHRSANVGNGAQMSIPIIEPAINVQSIPTMIDTQIIPSPQLDFKELVSQKCAERGIIFALMPGRREQGKQVYRAGKLFCYIDRNVVMLSDGTLTNWTPVSIPVLLEKIK